MPRPLHIAIVSTGRSGTTWLQLLLAHLYDAQPVGARNWDDETGRFAPDDHHGLLYRLTHKHYDDFSDFWDTLPRRAIIHAHWHAHPSVIQALEEATIPTITVARHPLDVLISHLAWVNRNTTDELGLDQLKGATPTSHAFLDFASGELAQWLLSITPGWWLRDVIRVRYEDLRADPSKEVQRITTELASYQAPIPARAGRGSRTLSLEGEGGGEGDSASHTSAVPVRDLDHGLASAEGIKADHLSLEGEGGGEGDRASNTPGAGNLTFTSRQIEQALAASDLRRLQSGSGGLITRLIPARQRATAIALWARFRGDRETYIEQHRERKHFWQGQPGLWRRFLPAEHAEHIAAAHQPSFDLFNYPVDPDPALTPDQAEANWRALL